MILKLMSIITLGPINTSEHKQHNLKNTLNANE